MFNNVLKELREKQRLSQSKLAKRAKFNHSYISRLESGNRVPTVEAVNRLANAMEIDAYDTDRLRISAGYMPESNDILFVNPIIKRINDRYSQLDSPCRDKVDLLLSIITGLIEPTM